MAAKKKRIRRSPEQARQHILDAAIRALSVDGPAGSSLKQVATEAGTSHALVTHYFGTYEALVEAAVEEAMTQVRHRLVTRAMALQNPTPEGLVQLYLDIALEPWYGRLVSWALFNDREGSSQYAAKLVPDMKLMAAATEYVFRNSGQAIGPEKAETLLVCVWSVVVGYVAGNGFYWRALGKKPGKNRDRDVREALGMLARGLTQ
ncbi:MAG TPA: TetR/AcrR family transcriptional regulator [Polyangiales bacterium]|nr:TetR/AcrR family transcriptional regulator [Polyangiales bacterium]